MEAQLHLFLNSTLDIREWLASPTGLSSGKERPGTMGGPNSRSDSFGSGEFLDSNGI